MVILYLHQYFNTPSMPGSTRSYEFAKRLVARGDTVYMITTNWQGASNKSYSVIDGIHVYWAPIQYSNKMNYFKRLFTFTSFIIYAFYWGFKLKYDIIIASSTPLTVGIPALSLKRLKKIKMIFEIRDLWPQLPIAIGALKSKVLISSANWLEKNIYKNSNHIICLSPGMKDELKLKLSPKKITVITNLSDVKNFQNNKDKDYIRKKIPGIGINPLVIYAGVFGRINGVDYIVDIANEMKVINSNLNFLLVGNGFGKKNIIAKSKEFKILNKNLYYLDYLPKSEMPKLLSCATIVSSLFIDLPEMNNNSANKFFDGLAAGKPVMINYGGWQKNLLESSGAGFIINKKNPKLAAKKINNIINDKIVLKNMNIASIDLADKFNIKSNYQKFEKVIDNVYKG
jgi:glycosyltransferase involved in cell wall biosynthesis